MAGSASVGPDLLGYSVWLDNFAGHDRAPRWTISNSTASGIGGGIGRSQTAAAHFGPGHYKRASLFVEDHIMEVEKGALSDAQRAPKYSFSKDSRVDKHGALKAVSIPNNRRHSNVGPGQYGVIDGMHEAKRVSRLSSVSQSIPKGEPQESVRERKLMGRAPGPGTYEAQSRFDQIDKRRQKSMSRLVRTEVRQQWQPEFARIFQSYHASAKSGLRRGAPGVASAPSQLANAS